MHIANLFESFWIIAFLVAFLHCTKKKSKADALIFFIPAFIWGYFVEFFGLYLYKMYYYPNNYFLNLYNVPLSIAFGWATIIYFGYFITTKKIHEKKLLNIDIDTVLISVGIDLLILEPLAFFYKFWIWTENNFWFGAPLFNFVGWIFAASIFVTFYNLIIKKTNDKKNQFIFMLLGITFGMLILQSIGLLYFFMIGAF